MIAEFNSLSEAVKLAIVAGVFSAFAQLANLLISFLNNRKLGVVHTLVNSRLSIALAEIESLKGTVSSMQTAKDKSTP